MEAIKKNQKDLLQVQNGIINDKISFYNDKINFYNDKISFYNDKISFYNDTISFYNDKTVSTIIKSVSTMKKINFNNDKISFYNDKIAHNIFLKRHVEFSQTKMFNLNFLKGPLNHSVTFNITIFVEFEGPLNHLGEVGYL